MVATTPALGKKGLSLTMETIVKFLIALAVAAAIILLIFYLLSKGMGSIDILDWLKIKLY